MIIFVMIDPKVLDVMKKVKREDFLPDEYKKYAKADEPIPIGYGQTNSQPTTVAIMTTALDVKPHHKVLEVGTGSGWQAAILSKLARKVITIERIPELYRRAKNKLKNYKNVKVVLGNGYYGYKEEAPYDRIIVTAAARTIPKPLVEQLKDNGKMVIPVGTGVQRLLVVNKKGVIKDLGLFRFVPLHES